MAQQKLGRKDHTIAVKTGTDANKTKFKKECVQGEPYFATDTGSLYLANSTAGASDGLLTQINTIAEVVTKTSNHTLTDSDNGKVIFCNSSSRIDITLPSGLATGFNCRLVQGGTGRVRILNSGTTVNGYISGANPPNAIAGQHGVVELIPVGVNTYSLTGDLDYLFIYGNLKSLGLDGVSDYMDVGNIAELNGVTSYSISYWVRENSAMVGQ
jgi:hypothetical protein